MKTKLLKRILTVMGIAFLYSLVFQVFYNWMRYYTVWPYEDLESLGWSLLVNYIPILICVVTTYCIVFKVVKLHRYWIKFICDAMLITLSQVVINYCFIWVTGMGVEWGGTMFNATFILLGMETIFYVASYKNSIRNESLAKQLALKYQYDALRAQVNPHFLFNSLNILSSLITIDTMKSQEFIRALSNMYRYIMSQGERDKVSIEEELQFLYSYIEILKIRYKDQFTVDIKFNSDITHKYIIPYTLQLLMENVTKHNVISTKHNMLITIILNDDFVQITNPIVPKKADTVSRIGTKYLTNLYNLHNKKFYVENDGVNFAAYVPYI